MKTPNQLYLVLTKEWFTEILEGRKDEEYRAFTDYYVRRLCVTNGQNEIEGFKEYDTVKFQLGYHKNAPQMIVEIKEIFIQLDNGRRPRAWDKIDSDNSCFVIALGKILEKKNC